MLQILGALFLIGLIMFLWDLSPLIVFVLAGILVYFLDKAEKLPKPTSFENITSAELSILYTACKLDDETHPLYQKCKFCPRRKNCDVSPLQKRVEKILDTLAKPPAPKVRYRRRINRENNSRANNNNLSGVYPANYNYDDNDFDADNDFNDAETNDFDSDSNSDLNYNLWLNNSDSDSGGGDSGGGDSGGGDSGGGDGGGN